MVGGIEARHRNIPRECEHGTGQEDQDAYDIVRSSLTRCGLIVVKAHPRPPTEKYTKMPSKAHSTANVRMRSGLGFLRPFSSMVLSSSERDSRRELCRLVSVSLR